MTVARVETAMHDGARSAVPPARYEAGHDRLSPGFERLVAQSRLPIGLGDDAPCLTDGTGDGFDELPWSPAVASEDAARTVPDAPGSAPQPSHVGRMPARSAAETTKSPGAPGPRESTTRFEVRHPRLGRLDISNVFVSGREVVSIVMDDPVHLSTDARRATIERALSDAAGRPVDLTVLARAR